MNCDIVRDLLPLYEDGLCSEESRKAVEEHLKSCEACRKLLPESPAEAEQEPAAAEGSAAESGVLQGISREWKRQKRRSWRRGILLGFALLLALALLARPLLPAYLKTGAMGMETDLAGDLLCGYNRMTGEAFAATYQWDGREETMDFTVPDMVFGYRVTALGGYVGRGAPYAFTVELPEGFGHMRESFGEDLWDYALEQYPNAEVVELPFTVHIGKDLEEIRQELLGATMALLPRGMRSFTTSPSPWTATRKTKRFTPRTESSTTARPAKPSWVRGSDRSPPKGSRRGQCPHRTLRNGREASVNDPPAAPAGDRFLSTRESWTLRGSGRTHRSAPTGLSWCQASGRRGRRPLRGHHRQCHALGRCT